MSRTSRPEARVRDRQPGPMIAASPPEVAGARERPYGIVPDEREALRSRLLQALDENDAVVLSGGVPRTSEI